MSRFAPVFRASPSAPSASAAGLLGRLWVFVVLVGCLGVQAQTQNQTRMQPQPRPRVGATAPATAKLLQSAATANAPAAKPAVDYGQRYAQQCAACHGADGKGAPNLAPSLAGQHSFYAVTQLFLFKNGRRDSELMNALAKDFTNDDLRGFSEAIGKLPAQPTQPTGEVPDAVRMALGKDLASKHLCISCHGADMAGSQQVPRLAGQYQDYLKRVLTDFQSGKRLGYTTAMSEALVGLKPEELETLAYYLARHTGQK